MNAYTLLKEVVVELALTFPRVFLEPLAARD